MNLLLIVLGLLFSVVPHVVAAGYYGGLLACGLPFAGELAIMIIVLSWFMQHDVSEWNGRCLIRAAFVSALSVACFELVCVSLPNVMDNYLLVIFEQILHAVSATLWVLALLLRHGNAPNLATIPLGVHVLAACGSCLWIIAQSSILRTYGSYPQFGLVLTMLSFLCSLPCILLLVAARLNQSQFVKLVLAFLGGAFLGNRLWDFLASVFRNILSPNGIAAVMAVSLGLLSVLFLVFWWLDLFEEGNDGIESLLLCKDAVGVDTSRLTSVHSLSLMPGYDRLSERERQVLLQSLDGATARQIADQIGISAATVRTYRSRALSKMGTEDVASLLVALRLLIQKPVSETTMNANTPLKRPTPLVGAVSLSVCVLFVAVCFRLPQIGFYRDILVWSAVAFLLVVGAKRVRRYEISSEDGDAPHNYYLQELASILIGCSVALVLAAVIEGPPSWLAHNFVMGAFICVSSFWVALRLSCLHSFPTWYVLCCFSCLMLAFFPLSEVASDFILGNFPMIIAMACAIAALAALKLALNDEQAKVGAVALVGNARTLEYLRGRGLSDLQAQVALLTVQNYPMGGIAATLHVSVATVAAYRSIAYKTLGVKGKLELIDLLCREAGFLPMDEESKQ